MNMILLGDSLSVIMCCGGWQRFYIWIDRLWCICIKRKFATQLTSVGLTEASSPKLAQNAMLTLSGAHAYSGHMI